MHPGSIPGEASNKLDHAPMEVPGGIDARLRAEVSAFSNI
ncbi:hypothetical protein CHELA20_51525 [Hyphomicrobiales bacterium]|nr:hypothetical protein CHELA41_23490 [Hyphomicrobiales bacterium]CAH1676665.1 hypothetical protein CHELA20_51525 [Hyphomicrobiales bacterium]